MVVCDRHKRPGHGVRDRQEATDVARPAVIDRACGLMRSGGAYRDHDVSVPQAAPRASAQTCGGGTARRAWAEDSPLLGPGEQGDDGRPRYRHRPRGPRSRATAARRHRPGPSCCGLRAAVLRCLPLRPRRSARAGCVPLVPCLVLCLVPRHRGARTTRGPYPKIKDGTIPPFSCVKRGTTAMVPAPRVVP